MKQRNWLQRQCACVMRSAIPLTLVLILVTFATVACTHAAFYEPPQQTSNGVMLILRGISNAQHPNGQLDDQSALEYARRLGYHGEVLDIAANKGADAQVKMALERIRNDDSVTAIYGFSGGGYNARRIWARLTREERERIGRIVVIGSPGVGQSNFPGSADVTIKRDPPTGHLAGPKALLDSLGPS